MGLLCRQYDVLRNVHSRAELRGIDAVNRETPESFALSRYPSWLKELHSTYNLDTAGKLSALEQLRYSSACVQAVRDRWEVQPGPQGGLGTSTP